MRQRTNEEWLDALRGEGAEQQEVLDDLRQYLLRATLYFLGHNRGQLRDLDPSEIEQLAQDIAQEAIITILDRLDDFRGESKFTTWVYSFAINIALVQLRRQRWKGVSLETLLGDGETPELLLEDEKAIDPSRSAQQEEIWQIVREVIDNELTDRQRQILVAVGIEDLPMDEVTQYYGMNRNAVYKMMHDARVRLRKRLEERGFTVDEILAAFHIRR